MIETLPGTTLEKDRVVPATSMIEAASGNAMSLGDYRQRMSLAVCFLHDRCEICSTYAGQLAKFAPDLQEADATALAVLTEPARLAIPVLVDANAQARQRFLGPSAELPLVLIVDKFGAAWRSFPSPGHAFPPPQEIVSTLLHLALECPECGVSTW